MDTDSEVRHSTLISHEYRMESIVYFKTDPEQKPYLVTGIMVSINGGSPQYRLGIGSTSVWGFENELTDTKDYKL